MWGWIWERGKWILKRIDEAFGICTGSIYAAIAIFAGGTGIGSLMTAIGSLTNFAGLIASGSAVSGFVSTAAAGFISAISWITSTFPFIAPALGTVGSFVSAALGAVPFLSQVGSILSPVLPAIGLVGLSWAPPVWGILAIAALPAIVGGLYEAGARTWAFIKGREDSTTGDRILRGLVAVVTAPITFPINFLYGFCRTAFHMFTGKGYLGCIKETYKSVNIDLKRETVTSELGGGSLLRGLVPKVVDRLVVGPVVGLFSGLAYSIPKFFQEGLTWKVLRAPWQGMWRGFWQGSQAAYDTNNYLSRPAPGVAQGAARMERNTAIGATKTIAAGLSLEMGITSTAKMGEHSRYDFAESVGRKEAYKLEIEYTDNKKEKDKLEQLISDEVNKEKKFH